MCHRPWGSRSIQKDVDVVMAGAADLVEVRRTLRQVVNVKGD
ncbi:MAG: hypothetical protein ACXVX0_18935 [Blastococcus sp.]